jgi:RHS repeat-associated protein
MEERNSQFSTSYLFNAKELDNETGLYYYGARYLDPTGAMWLSVDPMWEKYAGMSPYNYCMGNPVKLVDPDGRRTKISRKECCYIRKSPKNKYSVLGYGKITNKNGERVPKRVPPAIFTRWKLPPVDQSDERGKTLNGIYIFRSWTSKANVHEFIHTLGVPDNGYDKGGLLNSPIMPILPSEVDDIWNNCLNK